MHPDVLITIVLAGFVAFAALATGLVLLRIRLRTRAAAEERPFGGAPGSGR